MDEDWDMSSDDESLGGGEGWPLCGSLPQRAPALAHLIEQGIPNRCTNSRTAPLWVLLPPPLLPPPPLAQPCRCHFRSTAASAVSDADAAALGMDTRPPEFYDPEADDKDEAWAQRMRRCGGSRGAASRQGCPCRPAAWLPRMHALVVCSCQVVRALGSYCAVPFIRNSGKCHMSPPRFTCAPMFPRSHRSDAILSCPLCFTTLCIDCQQHDTYDNQFRAMFVMNCR